MRGQLTEKADVFSFGVVALEAVSGRSNSDNSLDQRNIYLLERVSCSTNFPFFFKGNNSDLCDRPTADNQFLHNSQLTG